jgi:outer membrane protein TolC
VAAAEQSYKDLQTQYSAGTAKSIDVLAELRSLNAARKDLAVQTLGLQLALKRIDVVSGVFQEQRVQKAMKP